MVVFFPLVSVMEFDKRNARLQGRKYTRPLLTDVPEEFDTCDPAYLNNLADALARVFRRQETVATHDDLCRLFLLAYYVNDEELTKIREVLEKYGARVPTFTDYRFIRHKMIRDPEAVRRHHAFIRSKYKINYRARPPS